MAYDGRGEEKKLVPELKLRMGDGNDDYLKLGDCEEEEASVSSFSSYSSCSGKERSSCRWIKLFFVCVCLAGLAAVFFKWIAPYIMQMEIIPLINWETTTFTTPQLEIIIFTSVALFPTFLLPSSPSMWVAGMTFGYGYGFLLIISAVAVGVSLPYFVGSLFYHKIQGWLQKYPKRVSLIKLAGDGNWFNQIRAVALIRISPFPYILYNYCAVATDVKYGPYILGSLSGMVPDVFAALYTGILIRTLADASHMRHTLSAPQVIFNIFGFFATIVTAIICTLYAKQKLQTLQMGDVPLLE